MTGGVEPGPLAGHTVLVTRERPGELAELLAERGADVVHLPLIATVDADDGGVRLEAAARSLRAGDWLLVTSAAGAERAGPHVGPGVRLGAVGTATAKRLAQVAGRPVDVVPERQLAAELATAVIEAAGRDRVEMLIAQADLAADTLGDRLRSAGHRVTVVTAYRTVQQVPSAERIAELVASVDALALASGSAARSWVDAIGVDETTTPRVVVAIGPSTADVCRSLGLRVDGVAGEHTLTGLVEEIEARLVHGDG